MVDADHLLLDDRSLVEVGSHVMRGGANEFHATVEGLMVRLGALESREERVVDVDGAAAQRLAGFVREHLHVPREHHQVGVQRVDEGEQLSFRLGLGRRGHRDVHER
ncbi:hypothetical protein EB73_35100 [Mycobacterium sp. SWH-M3]|nr:hypothetical protein EB73_35100 [Mycobacterium sp. SWH-M3]